MGWEYELTLNFEITTPDHLASAAKDRTGLFVNKDPFMLSIETGKQLREWCESGSPARDMEMELQEAIGELSAAFSIENLTNIFFSYPEFKEIPDFKNAASKRRKELENIQSENS